MSSGRSHQFLLIFCSIIAVGAIALGVLLFLGYRKYAEVSVTYDEQEKELQRLQALKPYPNQENLEALQKVKADFGDSINKVREQLAASGTPVEQISPTQFQDRLREMLAEIRKQAAVNNVALPEDFYLAFDIYRNEPPTATAAPALFQQLKVINALVGRLIESRVSTLEITRDSLAEESGGAKPASTKEALERDVIRIKFDAEAGALRNALNTIVTADQFLIIRTLQVQNEKLEGPARSSGETTASVAPEEEGGASRLEFIVGKEKLRADLRVEIVNFTNPETASAQSE